jgi:3'-5' exoribonuclease
VRVCEHYRDLDRDLVVIGVLFHDLGKLRELGAMPVNDYTLEGRLVGHVVIGRDILRDRCAAIPGFPEDLQLLLEHMVLSHQGKKEFASPVEPMTPEAVVLHFIDDLDSKLNQLRASREANPGIVFHRGMGRYIYVPALPPISEREMLEDVPADVTDTAESAEEVPVLEVQAPLFSIVRNDER